MTDSNAIAWAHSAFSWALQGDSDTCRAYVDKLSDDERDEVMRAATVLVAIAGGLPPELLVPR